MLLYMLSLRLQIQNFNNASDFLVRIERRMLVPNQFEYVALFSAAHANLIHYKYMNMMQNIQHSSIVVLPHKQTMMIVFPSIVCTLNRLIEFK